MKEIQNGISGAQSVVPTQHISTLSLDVFTPQEIARLISARDRFQHGMLNDQTGDHKRLLFTRWLYQQGKIAG